MAEHRDDYILDRSYIASARLNLQHFFWTRDFDNNLLHRTIPVPEQGLKVADIGTGTGIWLLDFARQHPQAVQLDGLDVSLDQVPDQRWLPSNVGFHLYDIYDDPPDSFVEKYDIIHVRHLTLVIKGNDPTPVIQNLVKMLKPGGHLQWGEFDLRNRVAVATQPDCFTVQLEALQQRMRDFLPTPVRFWPEELDVIFDKVGLLNVSFESNWPDRSYLSSQMDISLLAYEELIDMLVTQQRATQEETKELRTILAKAASECRSGAAWNIRKVVAVGQKPTQRD